MSILNFVFEEKSKEDKPIGTKITHKSGKTFVKESTGWYNVDTGVKLNYKSSLLLEADADRFKINFQEKPDGYYMNGMKMTPEQAKPFMNYERFGDEWYNKSNGSAIYREDSSKLDQLAAKTLQTLYKEPDENEESKSTEDNSEQKSDSNKEPENKNSKQSSNGTSEKNPVMYPDVDGRGYKIMRNNDGSWVHSGTGEILSPEQATPYENRYQQEYGSSDSKNASGNGKSDISQDTKQDTEESPSGSSSNQSTNIPNGYVYTSGKGNKFIFKNGTWYNASTKKPVNQSNVNMLNRSAEKTINDFNSKNDIKIGTKVTSNKGTEYTFNGTGFVSSDGKLLSGGAAQSAMNKLKAQSSTNNSEQGDAKPSSTVQGSNNTKNSTAQGSNNTKNSTDSTDSTIVPGESTLDSQPDSQGSSNTPPSTDNSGQSSDYNAQSIINNLGNHDQGSSGSTSNNQNPPVNQNSQSNNSNNNDLLTNLAQKIKSSKYNKQIVTLLSRGGDVNVLAADILLNGNIQEVIEQLKALNNSNTQ